MLPLVRIILLVKKTQNHNLPTGKKDYPVFLEHCYKNVVRIVVMQIFVSERRES